MVKITLPDGKTAEAQQMDIESSEEHWNNYVISDGNIISFKVVVTEIYRLESPDPISGKPNYMVRSNNVMAVKLGKQE